MTKPPYDDYSALLSAALRVPDYELQTAIVLAAMKLEHSWRKYATDVLAKQANIAEKATEHAEDHVRAIGADMIDFQIAAIGD